MKRSICDADCKVSGGEVMPKIIFYFYKALFDQGSPIEIKNLFYEGSPGHKAHMAYLWSSVVMH